MTICIHASSILKEAEERAARAYRAEETHYLINGSTAGILSAVLGCSERGRKILIALQLSQISV